VRGVKPGLNRNDAYGLLVLFPSLPEQKAIVEKLDSVFAEIDKLEANLGSMEKLSEWLLNSASRKFFDDSHDRVMLLCEIADFEGGQQPPKSEFIFEKKSGYVRFVQIRDFKSDRNVTYIPNSSRNRICKESDVFIGRYGASVGQILTGLAGAYNVALMKVLPKEEIVSRSYLFHYLQSESFQSKLANVAQRSAQAGFSKDDIANFPVPVPDLQAQDSIVNHLEEISTSIEKLRLGIRKKRELAKSLIKSMLNSEFTGVEDAA
jgi:type I restriction enzyme S subunit